MKRDARRHSSRPPRTSTQPTGGSSRPPRSSVRSMAPEEYRVSVGVGDSEEPAALRQLIAEQTGLAEGELPTLELRRRSIDARRGRVRFELVLGPVRSREVPLGAPFPREVTGPLRAIIVGAGPAGLFCAYHLARAGVRCEIIERGKPVRPRRKDLRAVNIRGEVNTDSNYCFGEGGAGTYSDGKLYTRSQKRGNVQDILETFVVHGAPPQILTDARPHIGTNLLPDVVTALRERLEGVGVRFRFEARVTGLLLDPTREGQRTVRGVQLGNGDSIEAPAVVLATGHSARDVYEMLANAQIAMEAKPFAVGVRIEHPQALIDGIQYGAIAGHARLPAAYYRCAATVEERGVYSFCMCPGGFMVAAATEPESVVLNGMSPSRRNSRFANSGIVVTVEPQDLAVHGYQGVMGGIDYQRRLEGLAAQAGGGQLVAPAARVTDFVAGRSSSTLPASSYKPGLSAQDVRGLLDSAGPPLGSRIAHALGEFQHQLRGFVSEEGVVAAVESRSSSPVRVARGGRNLESPSAAGLYPTGEGAGYAGGIVSAALDGVRVAEAILGRSSDR